MPQSLIPSRVKNTGSDLAIAAILFGGGVIFVSYLNRRFNILTRFSQGLIGIGQATGIGIGGAVSSTITGVGVGLAQGFGPASPSSIASTNAIREALGLKPDPTGTTYYPFTNIPINTNNNPSVTNQNAGPSSPPTNPVNTTPLGANYQNLQQSPNPFSSLANFIQQATSGQSRNLATNTATSNTQTNQSFLATYGRSLGLVR